MPTATPTRSPISVARKGLGKLAGLAATPLIPEDYLDLLSPLASRAELRGRIVEVLPETADAATLVIEPGRSWRRHTPGQYIRIGVDVDGVRQWRAYSLTSTAARPDGHISITVKAMPDGVVSNHLVHRAQVGTIVQLDQACGEFTLGEATHERALFVTAGSGITPVMGILRGCRDQLRDVVVVHSAPTEADVIFRAELRQLAADDHIALIERHTDVEGIVDAATLAALVPDLASRETWACGPSGLLDALEQHFGDAGIDERLHTERFRATALVTGDGGPVTFSSSAETVEADGATPLLDVGEAAGVLMPSGCRMGICHGCVAPLREGAVRDLRTGDLTTAMAGDNVRIQTCVSAAAGPCNIDL
ncbi:MAG: ferredoxin reductase [Solirubrobacterales bacterium]